jgi:hypothetical protein
MVEVTWTGSGIAAHSWPSWLSAIRTAQHLSVASATVGANSATVGTNSATDVRVSAETAMQHTMVIACVTVISEPLGKLPIRLVRRLGNGGSVVVVTGRAKPASRAE